MVRLIIADVLKMKPHVEASLRTEGKAIVAFDTERLIKVHTW